MAVPKKKTSKSRRNMRRSHDGLPGINISKCSNCESFKLPHHCCQVCGWYNGRNIVAVVKAEEEADG
jgi:large subunit ribosomal protein L32